MATTFSASNISVTGQWQPLIDWPIMAIHSVITQDGLLLTFGTDTSGAQGATMYHDLYDPLTGSHVLLDHHMHTPTDVFCSAALIVPGSDRILMAGGDARPLGFTNGPVNDSNLFYGGMGHMMSDPSGDMATPRWYPSQVSLEDGRILVIGGTGSTDGVPEIYTPGIGWARLEGAADPDMIQVLDDDVYATAVVATYYPRIFTHTDGSVFYFANGVGGNGTLDLMRLDPSGEGSVEIIAALPFTPDWEAPVVMYAPDKVLIHDYDNGLWTLDMSGPSPVFDRVGAFETSRSWSNMTVMADGRVLINGGSSTHFTEEGAVLTAAIWDPETGTLTEVGAEEQPRLYHSTGILLTDGTILSSGGGASTLSENDYLDGQIYRPGYLFNEDGTPADRPEILSAPERIASDGTLTISVDDPSAIGKITFVKSGAVTHSFNMETRALTLDFTVGSDGRITVPLPGVEGGASPGSWMLFVWDKDGHPSIAEMVAVDPLIETSATALEGDLLVNGSLETAYASDGRATTDFLFGWQIENGTVEIVGQTGFDAPAAPKIVAFGDSLFDDYGVPAANGFVARLGSALSLGGQIGTIVEAAVSGDTTAGALARIKDAVPQDADVVVVALGGNDMLQGIAPSIIEANLSAIVETLMAGGQSVVLAGVGAPAGSAPSYALAVDQAYQTVAARHGVPLVADLLAGTNPANGTMLPDGIHPNGAGISKMVDNLLPALTQMLTAELFSGNDLDGEGAVVMDGNDGMLSQSVKTEAGQTYRLEFDLGEIGTGSRTALEILWNGELVTRLSAAGAERVALTVAGTGGSDKLTFRSLGEPIVLDRVSLVPSDSVLPVPAPVAVPDVELLPNTRNTIELEEGAGLTYGTRLGDRMIGTAGDDAFFGGRGNDIFEGRGGYNQADYEGVASDYTFVRNRDGSVTATGPGAGTDLLIDITGIWFRGDSTWRALDDLAVAADPADPDVPTDPVPPASGFNIITADASGGYLEGTDGDDRFIGNAGDDTFFGGAGNDRLEGGAGYNQADFAGARADYVFERLADGSVSAQHRATGAVDRLVDIDGAWFSGEARWYALADIAAQPATPDPDPAYNMITASAGGGYVRGTDADDHFMGGAGRDVFFTGLGDDLFEGGAGYNQLDLAGNASDYRFTQNLDGSVTVVSAAEGTDTLRDIDGVYFYAESRWFGVDELTAPGGSSPEPVFNLIESKASGGYIAGTDASDRFVGAKGQDIFYGGRGDDRYEGGADYNQVDFDGARADYAFARNASDEITVSNDVYGTDVLVDIDGLWFRGEGKWYDIDDMLGADMASASAFEETMSVGHHDHGV